uniref:Uncharacterized protein n=1 Tax=Arundo donax TaxID=35708 RepID=A0A0A9FPV9_ARUDO
MSLLLEVDSSMGSSQANIF